MFSRWVQAMSMTRSNRVVGLGYQLALQLLNHLSWGGVRFAFARLSICQGCYQRDSLRLEDRTSGLVPHALSSLGMFRSLVLGRFWALTHLHMASLLIQAGICWELDKCMSFWCLFVRNLGSQMSAGPNEVNEWRILFFSSAVIFSFQYRRFLVSIYFFQSTFNRTPSGQETIVLKQEGNCVAAGTHTERHYY